MDYASWLHRTRLATIERYRDLSKKHNGLFLTVHQFPMNTYQKFTGDINVNEYIYRIKWQTVTKNSV